MDLKLINVFLASLLLISWFSSIIECKYIPPNQYQSDDGDVEFVTGSPDGIPGYPQSPGGHGTGVTKIFQDWMGFVQGFFKEGNWDNGGPANFARFLGNQISKLVQMLTGDEGLSGKK